MLKFITAFASNNFKYNVGRESASLAYYLMFSFFPLLIFLNSILGLMNITSSEIQYYIRILPEDIQNLVFEYLSYLSSSGNIMPLFLGLVLTLYSFTKCVNSLFHSLNNIFDIERPKRSLFKSFIFTFALMLSIYLMFLLVVVGGAITNFVGVHLDLSSELIHSLNLSRYFIAIGYFFLVLISLYKLIPNIKLDFKHVIAGSLYAMLGLFLISILFSFYVSSFANYSIIYGSLSAIMILMLWFYLSGAVIIQGCILNKMVFDISKN